MSKMFDMSETMFEDGRPVILTGIDVGRADYSVGYVNLLGDEHITGENREVPEAVFEHRENPKRDTENLNTTSVGLVWWKFVSDMDCLAWNPFGLHRGLFDSHLGHRKICSQKREFSLPDVHH